MNPVSVEAFDIHCQWDISECGLVAESGVTDVRRLCLRTLSGILELRSVHRQFGEVGYTTELRRVLQRDHFSCHPD